MKAILKLQKRITKSVLNILSNNNLMAKFVLFHFFKICIQQIMLSYRNSIYQDLKILKKIIDFTILMIIVK